jgi:hypothetical protein
MGHNTKYIPPRKTKSFVALIRQSGTSSSPTQTSGTLTVGRTYYVGTLLGDDYFGNVGGFSGGGGNNYYFIATGTTPTKWTNGTELSYNTGAPVVIGGILENTFLEMTKFGFTMEANGTYSFRSNVGPDGEFTEFKTIAEISNSSRPTITINAYRLFDSSIGIETLTNGVATNNILSPQSTPYAEANFIRVTVFI